MIKKGLWMEFSKGRDGYVSFIGPLSFIINV